MSDHQDRLHVDCFETDRFTSYILKSLYFKIADADICIQAPQSEEICRLLPSFRPFHITAPTSEVIMQMKYADNLVDGQIEGEHISSFTCGNGTHHFYRTAKGYKILFCTLDGSLTGALRATSDFRHPTVSLYGTDQHRAYALSNAILAAFTFAAVRHHILIVHASVICCQNKAILFLGRSGTGKSTHSRLWLQYIPGSELLNDDSAAVRLHENGETIVYGTPWSGKTPCYKNKKCDVQAFVRLQQDAVNQIRKEDLIHAFSSLYGATSQMGWDDTLNEYNLATVEQIVLRKPVYLLHCLPDQDAAELNFHTTLCTDHRSSRSPN